VQSEDHQNNGVGSCAKHLTIRATGRCADCRLIWCDDCLVPPVAKRQPLRCIECALIAGGVRAPGGKYVPGIEDMTRHKKRPTSFI